MFAGVCCDARRSPMGQQGMVLRQNWRARCGNQTLAVSDSIFLYRCVEPTRACPNSREAARHHGGANSCMRSVSWCARPRNEGRVFPAPRRETGRLSLQSAGSVQSRPAALSADELPAGVPARPVPDGNCATLRRAASEERAVPDPGREPRRAAAGASACEQRGEGASGSRLCELPWSPVYGNGARTAPAPDCMQVVVARLTDDDVKAVAAYLASLPPSQDSVPAKVGSWPLPFACGSEPQ